MSSVESGCSGLDAAVLPRPPTKKWVTFDDLIDDAMEGGKLSPRKNSFVDKTKMAVNARRNSLSSSAFSSSVSSQGSFEMLDGRGTVTTSATTTVMTTTAPVDFSQSLNTTEETTEGKFFPTSVSEMALSSSDKYAALTTAQKKQYKGWSTKVLHGTDNKFGWSAQLLEYGSSDGAAASSGDDDGCWTEDDVKNGDEASWYVRKAKGTPWNTSPRRTFIRNFP
jgi:hypothetical protein